MATTRTSNESSTNDLSSLWHAACNNYAKETGITINDEEFPRVSGPEQLSHQLDAEEAHFQNFRTKKSPLLHTMQTILVPFENWGDLIGDAVAAAFPPASSIMGAMLLLIRSARKVSESFDMITDLFQKLSNFALRLDIYKGVPLSKGIQIIIVKILVNFRVCAASQKLLKAGSFRARLSKWAKNIFVEDISVSSLLAELQGLTSQEDKMISAQNLNLTHQALKNTADLLERDNVKSDRDRLNKVRDKLKPVSASSQVHSAISSSRIPGSGKWINDRIKSWWQSSQPILWLHGGPAVGKSYLAAKIIDDLTNAEISSMPVVASFFCKNNDIDLRSMNKALRTLAWQVAAQLPRFADHAEDFCLKADLADTYSVWWKLLLKFFTGGASDVSVWFVINGIDEVDPEEQNLLFDLLEKTYSLEEQSQVSFSLRFVLLSRDSVRSSLEEHLLGWVPDIEITNSQNKEDLHRYIYQKLQRASLFKGSSKLLDEIVDDIRESAEGLWEWANLVIKSVLHCSTKGQIRRVVKTMPRGISAMLSQELQRLARQLSADMLPDELNCVEESGQIQQLNLILSFIMLEDEVLNVEDNLRIEYSSLFVVRDAGEAEGYFKDDFIVTLRHSSFYEFFKTSGQRENGPIHVDPERAEASLVFVLLHALHGTDTSKPETYKSLGLIETYADSFLPLHLTSANPENAGNLQDEISALILDVFAKDIERGHPFVSAYYVYGDSYSLIAWSWVTDFGYYWFDAGGYNIANERAQQVLKWLLPAAREIFEECARYSVSASDMCPFTILFSPLAVSLSRHWLAPDVIEARDGCAHSIPIVLNIFGEMAGNLDPSRHYGQAASPESTAPDVVKRTTRVEDYVSSSRILLVAKLQQHEMTTSWHTRVGQALLSHSYFRESLEHFEKSLSTDEKSRTLSSESLSVIHRNMASACFAIGMYKEAVEHNKLADTLGGTSTAVDFILSGGHIRHLLNAAQLEYIANMPNQAVAKANEAWQAYLEREDDRDWYLWINFLFIFLGLEQPHLLRPVFELALSHFQELSRQNIEVDGLAEHIIDPGARRLRTTYKAIRFGLTPDDEKCLQLMAWAVKRITSCDDILPKLKFLIGTALFEKGQFATGILNWYEAVTDSNPNPVSWQTEPAQERSLSYMAAVCLYHPEISFCSGNPLTLDSDAEFGDICLIISSWLRDSGDHTNARKALCGRVKKCISLLSDDDPSNDCDA
ncbi:NACHT domain protein [Talaromyces stipitatus ATCC 10500]|uniref:NACHT domain protein n=1 Tax=Talaromyces stipitatus (strain ATCC 10500 / CBS 375.48 / QM 6759 / NRRL 1006) TaxID=441959 RepID=B8M529_TALSN|nr:NACHT domain protein [Talaromyces stipitatus ATCC 10500]EED19635.1 NACHT domain protein [Talaromyces stipitatus ATCC 10500]